MKNSQKKICLRLIGGVGNQLFCYSYARSLAEKTGRQLTIDTSTGFLRDKYKRVPRIKSFLNRYNESSLFEKVILLLTKKFPDKSKFLFKAMYMKERDSRSFEMLNLADIEDVNLLFLEGYFQSYRYFDDNIELIKREIEIKVKLTTGISNLHNMIITSESVAIHVRRLAYDNLLELDYYRNAIAIIKDRKGSNSFFFFSDDIEWCKDNFSLLEPSTFVQHDSNDEMVDLWLMTQCKHHIIANSSFSWWGAWLATNQSQIIVAPQITSIGVENMFYPDDWVIV